MDEHKIVMAAITLFCTLGCLSSISPAANTVITGVVIVALVLGLIGAIGFLMQINCQHPAEKNTTIPAHQAWFEPDQRPEWSEPEPAGRGRHEP